MAPEGPRSGAHPVCVQPCEGSAVRGQAGRAGRRVRQTAAGGARRAVGGVDDGIPVPVPGLGLRLPGRYRDLLLDIGAEEMGHVEMICTMIARLLADAPPSVQEASM